MNELAEPFPISVQAVSKHLKVLERAGLITRGRSAQLRPSRLQGAPLKEAVDWLEKYRGFWQGELRPPRRASASDRAGTRAWLSTSPRPPDHDHPRLRRAARARLEGVDRARALRRLVRRRPRPRCRSSTRVDGRQARRRVAADDVRRARAPRDPLEGRVPRGRRARAARVHHLRPAGTTPTSWSPSSSPTSATAGPRCSSSSAGQHVRRGVRARRPGLGRLLRPHGGASGRLVSPVRAHFVTPSSAASTSLSRSTSPRIPAAASLNRNASASFTIAYASVAGSTGGS